jgi:hypothetical protein
MGLKTESLDPKHEYVPWIVLNGLHTEDIQVPNATKLFADVISECLY